MTAFQNRMNRREFVQLISRLEPIAHKEPARYKFRVLLLAILGYAYLFLVLALLIASIVLLVWLMAKSGRTNALEIKALFALGLLVYVIVRALFVRIPPPVGIRLTAKELPDLFRLIEKTRRAMRAPRVHVVLLTPELNAAVTQIPRLGFLGWSCNYLTIGLTLLHCTTPEQFQAVLAHEFGHLSGEHGQFGSWIYRIRQTWQLLVETLEQARHWGAVLFGRFFTWYVPFFGAYSFVLARSQEYEADRRCAQLAGSAALAEALAMLEIRGQFLEKKFWPNLYKKADADSKPPPDAFSQLQKELGDTALPSEAALWVGQAMKAQTGADDTHPALMDRLAAIRHGQPLTQEAMRQLAAQAWVASTKDNAARFYLGSHVERLAGIFSREWAAAITAEWQKRHEYAKASKGEYEALNAKAATQPLNAEEQVRQAALALDFQGPEAAIPLFRQALAKDPVHPRANYTLGCILLDQQNDEEGVSYVEQAMKRSPNVLLSGCEVISGFYSRQGRLADAERYRERAGEYYQELALARQERLDVHAKDTFEPHQEQAQVIESVRQQLSRHREVDRVYLVRKTVRRFPEVPLYVLGVVPKSAWFKLVPADRDRRLAKQLVNSIRFPGEVLFVILNRQYKKLRRVFDDIPNSVIYDS